MFENTEQVIARIGETDQLYLTDNTPELALERASLRLQLVNISHSRQEQIHFLQEGIVLLEQARFEYEEMPIRLFVDLSLQLARAYMLYFKITQEQRFALITQQILKPMTVHEHGDIYLLLAYACAVRQENALTRYWLTKYSRTAEFDPVALKQHSAFDAFREDAWFVQLIQERLH
ncbi:hypothetical protein [Acinetobacter sp. WZC-1]|uniref:hypothetical protein n=1 Tax=Acinetobacter sp. WZC-1 TaxID=3459034 RepID=UPI00403DCCE6